MERILSEAADRSSCYGGPHLAVSKCMKRLPERQPTKISRSPSAHMALQFLLASEEAWRPLVPLSAAFANGGPGSLVDR